MTTTAVDSSAVREAAARRAAAFADGASPDAAQLRLQIPGGAGRSVSTGWQRAAATAPMPAALRAKKVDRDGKSFFVVEGYYTTYERGYEMWDWYGPYTEVVSAGAGEKTIASQPDVVFLVNHRGLAMARTLAGTLELWSDETGCGDRAWLNPNRSDVKDLVLGIEDGTITEQSFAFMITKGHWSPDYSEYRIDEFDQERGDTSAVNYGANPTTSIAARSREILDELDKLPAGAARAALDRLNRRGDLAQMTQAAATVPAQMTPPVETHTTPGGSSVLLADLDAWLAQAR